MNDSQIKEILEITELEKLFKLGEKTKDALKTGLEYERIPVNINTGQNIGYYDYKGILNFLNKIAHNEKNWEYITDNTNGNVLGLKNNKDTITLEPGCQVELSIEPEFKISKLEEKIVKLDTLMNKYLQLNEIKLLSYGISPFLTFHKIDLLPKNRYNLMAKYMWGILADVMMRETAGIQCCIDFENEEDMAEKFTLANKLSPFMTAMYANSPIRGGVETGYKSFRALSWLYTDNERCGFASNLSSQMTYKNYIQRVLNTPMIFITRNRKNIPINGKITFLQYLKHGFEGFEATTEDFKLHANLYFPEIRLRNFIEIRNHDCVNQKLMLSIPTIYKAILYKKSAREDLKTLLKKYTFEDFEELRYTVPKTALQTKIGNITVSDIAKEIINIAEKSLVENNENEEKYLDCIKELTFNNICPADITLQNWYLNNKNPKMLIDSL